MTAANGKSVLATPVSLLFRLRQPEASIAWDRFVELYSPLLFRWAKQLGLQNSDSADLVQDVFLILWRNLPAFQYDSTRSFHAWLKTIFLNRHRARLRQPLPVAGDASGSGVMAPFESGVLDAADAHFLIQQAFRLIEAEFSELHQQAFKAYVLEERPPEEVAAKLKISQGTVYLIKSRILRRLREELQHLID